jgi:hypothetical protein
MDHTDDRRFDSAAPGSTDAMVDAHVLPELTTDPGDRSMLLVQYVLALIAVIAAILLTQAS